MCCKVCDSKADSFTQLGTLSLLRCRSCGLIFVGNQFTDAALAAFYDKISETYYDECALLNDERSEEATHDLSNLMPRSVLDVGCGDGNFLEHLRKLYSHGLIAGLEISEVCARKLEAKGFTVYRGSFESVNGPRFDLLTLLDVAEHVPRPVEFLTRCSSVLTSGGYLYIHTPRHCFWDSVFIALVSLPGLGRLSRIWLRTRVSQAHLHLWTDRALRMALAKAGFTILFYKKRHELSWPVSRYVETYLNVPRSIANVLGWLFQLTIVRLLRNKAVVLARAPISR
jgi:2-polyprenyl-3-methyl-5-hydroxy-6-metoxy-1,4-benzoquinol methylase